jgi:uncharacterized protein
MTMKSNAMDGRDLFTPLKGASNGETDALLERISLSAQQIFENARGSHDWDHTLRVHACAERIGPKKEPTCWCSRPRPFCTTSAGRSGQKPRQRSAMPPGGRNGARDSRDRCLSTTRSKDNIVHCVRAHRFGTITARLWKREVLFDADKLDAIGAVGWRAPICSPANWGPACTTPTCPGGMPAYSRDDTGYREFVVKLSKIKARMLTAEGRRLAEERHAFMLSFSSGFIRRQKYEGFRFVCKWVKAEIKGEGEFDEHQRGRQNRRSGEGRMY